MLETTQNSHGVCARFGLIDESCKLKGKQDLAWRVKLPQGVAWPRRVQ
jgi:hypothetical protein